MNRFTLKELRMEARAAAGDIEVAWEKLDSDPEYREDFETILASVARLLPEIERLYEKLTKGEHIFFEGEDTRIGYADREMFLDKLESELFESYQVMDLWERYTLIENITSLDKQNKGD